MHWPFIVLGCGATKSLPTAKETAVKAKIDLVNIEDDKVQVSLDPGSFSDEEVVFFIPATVPGTYSLDDYGQYVEGFKAFDYQGNEISFERIDSNSWRINSATSLDRISYYVNDTYDLESSTPDVVFSPAGTNIVEGKNFVLNLHGFVGYFDDIKEVPYEIEVVRPDNLEYTTSLSERVAQGESNSDIFLASRYFEVIDNPILYAEQNTEEFQIEDITVTISLYSPNNVYKASDFRAAMEKMMRAQKAFLGEVNATSQYSILIYLSSMEDDDAMGFGALEHHTSTVVVMPEQMPKPSLEKALIDIVSHEFFHIVTPLNVHSREIHYFDYNDPKMSQHLWMYEGTTEYFANLFQIQQGLIDEAEFYSRIMQKMENASSYDDAMSFTEMSRKVLQEPYSYNYPNVYEKGTLIKMALDIHLRDLSKGEKGVLWLMRELSAKYDEATPFDDDQLFDEIVSLTYPEIGTFFEKHVIGGEPIDYEELLGKAGLVLVEKEESTGHFLRGEVPFIDIDPADKKTIFIRKGIPLNSFFQSIGAKGGDVISSINGIPIELESIRPIIIESFGWNPDQEIEMVVLRDGQEISLSGKAGSPTVKVNVLELKDRREAKEDELREIWMSL